MRSAEITRKTKETDIYANFVIDGGGLSTINTGIPFFDHMLDSFVRHGRFDLTLTVTGDLNTGPHHTVEDTGIVLGLSFLKALGDGRGIERFSNISVPMDESRADVIIDIGGRPYLVFDGFFSGPVEGVIDPWLVRHFFESFVQNAKITAHMEVKGSSDHHKCEALFKSFGRALRYASGLTDQNGTIPSTKGVL
ncbi:MAG: imidazoleglycerol-phosphate dehydratase HisB [Methanomicrobiales archaeon]|nr:imidazoleglycerol-phosphate dehydratase HisB [Methanomicrobiales archaeon]